MALCPEVMHGRAVSAQSQPAGRGLRANWEEDARGGALFVQHE